MISVKGKRYINISSYHDAQSGDCLFVDLTNTCCDIYLPKNPVPSDEINIYDSAKKITTNPINLISDDKFNGKQEICYTITSGRFIKLIYIDQNTGWYVNIKNNFKPITKQKDGTLYTGIDSIHYLDPTINEVWSWGNNDYGQLNCGKNIPYSNYPLINTEHKHLSYSVNGKVGGGVLKTTYNGPKVAGIYGDNKYTRKITLATNKLFSENLIYLQLPDNISKFVNSGFLTSDGDFYTSNSGYNTTMFDQDLSDYNSELAPVVKTNLKSVKDCIGIARYQEAMVTLFEDGTVKCCGDWNLCGTNTASSSFVTSPTPLSGNHKFSSIFGDETYMALKSDNTLWYWGGRRIRFPVMMSGIDSQYPYNIESYMSPQMVKSFSGKPKQIYINKNVNAYDNANQYDLICLDSDGHINVWYYCMNASKSSVYSDKNVSKSFSKIASSYKHIVGLDENGDLYGGFIEDSKTSLGINPMEKIPSDITYKNIFGNDLSIFAEGNDGNIYCSVNDPYSNDSSKVIKFNKMNFKNPVKTIMSDYIYKDNLDQYRAFNGDLNNFDGVTQLINTPFDCTDLQMYLGDETVYFYSTLENKLFAYGNPTDGQIGPNGVSNKLVEIPMPSGISFKDIQCGTNHVLALDQYNHIWAWGQNQNGQLGDGTFTNRSIPVQIGNREYVEIKAGSFHSLALDQIGTAYTWGSDCNGQLGLSEYPEDNYEDIILWYNDVSKNCLDDQKDYIASIDKRILNNYSEVYIPKNENRRYIPGMDGFYDMRVGMYVTITQTTNINPKGSSYGLMEFGFAQKEGYFEVNVYGDMISFSDLKTYYSGIHSSHSQTKDVFIEVILDARNRTQQLVVDGVYANQISLNHYTYIYPIKYLAFPYKLMDDDPKWTINKVIVSHDLNRDLFKLKDINGYPGYKPKTLNNMSENEDITLYWNCNKTIDFCKGFNDYITVN